MSITVIVSSGQRELSRYARSQSMDDVLAYLRGWCAPAPVKGDVVARVEAPGARPQTFALRFNGKHTTLVRS